MNVHMIIMGALSLTSVRMEAQPITPALLTELPPLLAEVSGLVHVDGHTWICLDSGNDNAVFRVDPTSGMVLQRVVLNNAINRDQEELTSDGAWLYVGDMGNNGGDRTDLRMHRFALDLLQPSTQEVTVDTIRFSYADQTDLTPAYEANNWDCEAFIVLDDSVFLFTKNWLDERTHVYALPATPGVHIAQRRDAFDTEGLITGATRDPATGAIILLGHTATDTEPFIWYLSGYTGHAFFSGTNVRHTITEHPLQAEAVAFIGNGVLRIGSEADAQRPAALWHLDLPVHMQEEHADVPVLEVYPNPTSDRMRLRSSEPLGPVRLLDAAGALITALAVSTHGEVDMPRMTPGMYFLEALVHGRPVRARVLLSGER